MNIKDIARIAGVSPSTVSKIINGKDSTISQETREKVLKVAKEYHYTPYGSSAQRGTRTYTLAVLLRTTASIDSTLDGIIQTAQASGYSTLVFNGYSDNEQELKNMTAVLNHQVDGVIWQPVNDDSRTLIPHPQDNNIPTLVIGPYGGDKTLLLPYKEAAYRLTEEIIERGHQSIACLMTQGRRTKDFLKGFRACLFDHHMAFSDDMIHYEFDDSLIAGIGDRSITGIVSSHYRMALEFSQLMASLHYLIPDDVSLVSIKNDTSEALVYPGGPQISTYTMRNADFGAYLCSKLINIVEKRNEEPHSFVQNFHLDNTLTLDSPSTSRAKKITVVGSLNTDTYISVPTLPQGGTTVITKTATRYPGGKGINQAVGAAKLGHRVSLIGNVGTDGESDYIFKEMAQWGVDTTGVKRQPGNDTGKAYIFVDPNGESMISVLSGANATLSPEDIREREDQFDNTGYCLIQSEVPLDAVNEACRIAHEHHARTILKPTTCNHLPDSLLKQIDILVPNINELNALQPGNDSMEEKSRKLIERGTGNVIVTLAERGCYLQTSTSERRFAAAGFAPVDNTGAGDAFISALASYLLYGYPLEQAIEIATYAAGYSITREGVIPSLIDRFSLDTHIRQIGR
ncbi:PfkB family carbohydrate kinase [Bifidobacterium cebidarum]|uniref:Ribokinase n=1 Tax=Bifidobacterium cebidarum TaxID=2650773 RepID=A0A6I1GI60_9BIFI|nr:PfkB family carbohydrate kinase [Bifidobacterium cebidarum]KAB7789127.1 ribokinase [Bifidobacterium cebidarum]